MRRENMNVSTMQFLQWAEMFDEFSKKFIIRSFGRLKWTFWIVFLSCAGWTTDASAIGTARYNNPACYSSECDAHAAKAECEAELAIAKADPTLQTQGVFCANKPPPYYHPEYYFAFPGSRPDAIHEGYFNYYQNHFPYVAEPYQPNPNLGCCLNPEQSFGDPVNAATGNKFESEPQYTGQGVFPLSLSLYYNNMRMIAYVPEARKIFGRNRTHSYLRGVSHYADTAGESVQVVRPDGKSYRFVKSGTQWLPDRPNNGQLKAIQDAGGLLIGWEYIDRAGGKEAFAADGRLLELHSATGFKQTLVYDESGRLSVVIDAQGRSLSFQYGASGLVSQVLLPDGRTLAYLYTVGGDLKSVRHPDGAQTQYLYDEAAYVSPYTPEGSLTGVIDESAQRYSSTIYSKSSFSDNARAINTTIGGGVGTESAVYNFHPNNKNYALDATVTLAGGATRQIVFAKVKDVILPVSVTTSCDGCTTQTKALTYDANGMIDKVAINGVETDYDHNARGLEIQRIEATNDTTGKKRTIQTEWHPIFRSSTEQRVLDYAGALKARTNWTYNTRNQMLAMTVSDPSATPSVNRTTTYAYCEEPDIAAGVCPLAGLLKSTDGERTDIADVTAYSYRMADEASCAASPATCPYRKGDLWKVTNAQGQLTETLKYDGAGRPLSIKDINGIVTDLEYDPRGRLIASKVRGTNDLVETDDRITRVEYWPTGLVKKVIGSDGVFTAYTYDAAHRLTGIADNEGSTITYTLNGAGERTREDVKDAAGTLRRTLSRSFNALGQLQTLTDAYGRNTGFTYDANGNLDRTTDALTRVADNDYDPLGRLSRTLQDVAGIAAETKLSYDALDNLTQVTDPKNLNTSYTYNAFGEATQLSSPDTGTTTSTYDSAGNLSTRTDARGVTATFTYDALNRLTGITYPDSSRNVAYAYDTASADCLTGERFAKGRLAAMTDASGSTSYCYDRYGQLARKIQTTQGRTFVLRYLNTDPRGRLPGQDYLLVKPPPGNQMIGWTYPDGTGIRIVRDAQSRPTELKITQTNGQTTTLLRSTTYHPFGPVAQWTYGNGRVLRRSLNQNYQPDVIEGSGPGGISEGYRFDAVGNLESLRNAGQFDPIKRSYRYDGLNRLTEVREGVSNALLQAYAYDKTGNRTAKTEANGQTTPYTYAPDKHHLTQVGTVGRQYDAVGNTVRIEATPVAGEAPPEPGIGDPPSPQPGTGNPPRDGGPVAESMRTGTRKGIRKNAARVAVASANSASTAVRTFGYDDANRLRWVARDGELMRHYLYNGKGEQVHKVGGGVTVTAIYDEAGRWIGDYDAGGQPIQQAIWLDDLPVGLLVGAGANQKLYYLEADALGTPRVVIDPNRNDAVWRWDLVGEAFGDQAPNEDPDGDGVAFTFDMRFPGQRYDVATGLSYNYFRDYDATVGRYVESDPVGLNGGVSTYGYVKNAPLIKTDPSGLVPNPAEAACVLGPNPVCGIGVVVDITTWGMVALGVGSAGLAAAVSQADTRSQSCDDEECRKLKAEVDAAKIIAGKLGACSPGMSRYELQLRLSAWLRLATAREKHDVKCWKGGNDGHQQARAQVWTVVGACSTYLMGHGSPGLR